MKSISDLISLGHFMDDEQMDAIIPVSATSTHAIEGGPIVQQAVPEDYFLASICLRALHDLNGRDLEFIMKAYLPIRVLDIEKVNRIAFIESLGLVSSEINPLEYKVLEELVDIIDIIETEDDIFRSIDLFQKILDTLTKEREVSIAGLLSKAHNLIPYELLEWPSIPQREPFSFILSDNDNLPEIKQVSSLIDSTIEFVYHAEEIFTRCRRNLAKLARTMVTSIEESVKPQVERLDTRIAHLKQEAANLHLLTKSEKSEEIKRTLEARKKALKRDEEHRTSLIEKSLQLRAKFDERLVTLDETIERGNEKLQGLIYTTENISITKGSVDLPSKNTYLLLPFMMMGFTKKGKLEIELISVSRLTTNVEKLGRRRDFVYPFEVAYKSVVEFEKRISDRINSDVSLRKTIRNNSENFNLLSLKQGRSLIREGANGLVADGYVKPDVIETLNSTMDTITETALPEILHAEVHESSDELSNVKFHILDEANQPVHEATITIGAKRFQSSQSGTFKTTLPVGKHLAKVKAFGFLDSKIEFTLDSAQDAVVPITLSPLPTEERLELALDRLVKRADRIDAVRLKLWAAFQKHGSTLLSIPAYRSSLKELLSELGYDPENWIAQAKTREGMVKRLLKRDDRTDGIRRDVLKIAEASKQAGGIMLIATLLNELDSLGWDVVPDEIDSILDDMKRDGLIVGTSSSITNARIVQFIPVTLTDDPNSILEIAASHDGVLTLEEAVLELGWTEERVMNSLDLLVERGVAKIQQSFSSGTKYWFPGFRRGKN